MRLFWGVHIAVLSGAGISAESGVPTFRDDATGLWAKYDPTSCPAPTAGRTIPNGCGPGICGGIIWSAEWVNAGHRAVADWQDHCEVTVITQNVDDLHERAAATRFITFMAAFSNSGAPHAIPAGDGPLPDMPDPELEKMPPTCECGGLIRRGSWFGEQLPDERGRPVWTRPPPGDAMVVVGTSGLVYPAAALPDVALASGAWSSNQSGTDAAVAERNGDHSRKRQHGASPPDAPIAGLLGR